jgi:cytochrome P450
MRLDPFSDSYQHDPAATWRRIFASGRTVGYDADLGLWLIAGHDNVRTVLSDPVRFANAATLAPIMPVSPAAAAVLAGIDAPPVGVTADPPHHLRTRAVMRALFPTTAIRAEQQWGGLVQRRVDELTAEMAEAATVDLTHFAIQVPLRIILDILGLPTDSSDDVRTWIDDFDRLVWGNPDPDSQLACAWSCLSLWQYCSRTVTDRAAGPDYGGGLIGDLLRFRGGDDSRLTVAEIAALTLNIAGAGWETSAGALGHAMEHALTEPGRWAQVAHDEHYLSVHVE